MECYTVSPLNYVLTEWIEVFLTKQSTITRVTGITEN